jgi:uncharacterized membrane protein YgcG
MSNKKPEPMPESIVEHRLEELKDVPERNPLQAASGRARFLKEAAGYQQAVSPGKHVRQSGWIFPIRKEKFAMNALVSLILVASLFLGGSFTVAAAQDDLPNQPLYQVKLWTEDAALALAGTPQKQATVLMNMAQRRVEEMAALAEDGITPPDQVREQLEQHLNQTLALASNMDEPTLEQTLLQLRDHLQTQDRIMEQLQTHANATIEPLLTQTRQMLQTRLRLVDEGLADPQGFRYMLENQMRYGQDEEATPEPNQQGEPGFHQNDQSGQPTNEPGTTNGTPGGQNPDSSQNGNGGNGTDNQTPGGQNPKPPQGGQGGNGSGGGGGNK